MASLTSSFQCHRPRQSGDKYRVAALSIIFLLAFGGCCSAPAEPSGGASAKYVGVWFGEPVDTTYDSVLCLQPDRNFHIVPVGAGLQDSGTWHPLPSGGVVLRVWEPCDKRTWHFVLCEVSPGVLANSRNTSGLEKFVRRDDQSLAEWCP